MTLKITVMVLYVLTIIIVGVIGLKKTRTFVDFFLGGKSIGPWMTAFTYGTAYFSAVLFIGFAGKIGWSFGYSGLWIALGNSLIGVLFVWWVLGPRIRQMSDDLDVTTMAEFFDKRYRSSFLKLFTPIIIFIFFIPYSAAVFIGLAYLFRATFQIDYVVALLFMGLFTAFYLILGGYKSMSLMDVVFGFIMIGGVSVLVFSTLKAGGGLSSITGALSDINPDLVGLVGPPGWWPLFSLVFLTSVAPMAMPQLVQKFYAVRDIRSIRIGMGASTFFAVLICGIAYFTGATTRILLSPGSNPHAFSNGKPLFDALMPELLANVIPESLSILMLLLILSASMSTLAALVLVSSSSVSRDLYTAYINPRASDQRQTLLMRISSGIFILISVILAYYKPATIVAILGISWGAIGSAFLGPFFWGLICKYVNRNGAVVSAVSGLGTCLFLYLKGMPSPQAGTLGMLVSFAANPLFSFIPCKKSIQTDSYPTDR